MEWRCTNRLSFFATFLFANACFSCATAQLPTGYYATVDGSNAASLRLTLHELIELTSTQLSEAVEAVRKLPEYGQVGVEAGAIHFPTGQRLLDWLNETKANVKAGEVKQ